MEYADVSSTFVRLADTHLVQRCPLLPEPPQGPPGPAPTLVLDEKEMYTVPRLNLTGEGAPRGAREAQRHRVPTFLLFYCIVTMFIVFWFFFFLKLTPLCLFFLFSGRAGEAQAVV